MVFLGSWNVQMLLHGYSPVLNEKMPHFCLHKPWSLLLGGLVDKELQQKSVLRVQLAHDRVAFATSCSCGCRWVCAAPVVSSVGAPVSDVTKGTHSDLTDETALGIFCLAAGTVTW